MDSLEIAAIGAGLVLSRMKSRCKYASVVKSKAVSTLWPVVVDDPVRIVAVHSPLLLMHASAVLSCIIPAREDAVYKQSRY